MKTFFLKRVLREKVLLLTFAALALLIWAGQLLGRSQKLWDDWRTTRSELAAQQIWLQNGAAIDAKAAATTKSLQPAQTLNATQLVGELNTLASAAGLNADISAQRTERTDQFAFHTVQVNLRRADLASLIKFYRELSKRAPYIGLEQFSLAVDRANPGQLNASFRISSAELSN
jgi:hypothetical protein